MAQTAPSVDVPQAAATSCDRIGVDELFRAHAPFVAGFLRRLGAPAAELDDMVQDVFMVAHRKGGYVPGAGQPRTWLAAIALRIALAGRRARSARNARNYSEPGGSASMDLARDNASDPAEQFEARRAIDRVQSALDTLPLEQRATFVLYELEGESCASIAAQWDVPLGTVYSRLHNARERFLEAYQRVVDSAPKRARRCLTGVP